MKNFNIQKSCLPIGMALIDIRHSFMAIAQVIMKQNLLLMKVVENEIAYTAIFSVKANLFTNSTTRAAYQ